jgi:hypothetical protein
MLCIGWSNKRFCNYNLFINSRNDVVVIRTGLQFGKPGMQLPSETRIVPCSQNLQVALGPAELPAE